MNDDYGNDHRGDDADFVDNYVADEADYDIDGDDGYVAVMVMMTMIVMML